MTRSGLRLLPAGERVFRDLGYAGEGPAGLRAFEADLHAFAAAVRPVVAKLDAFFDAHAYSPRC